MKSYEEAKIYSALKDLLSTYEDYNLARRSAHMMKYEDYDKEKSVDVTYEFETYCIRKDDLEYIRTIFKTMGFIEELEVKFYD